ncbi:hypothetical protein NMY22_g7926 [Coprinellus aureogranulatus]|nr:hypothetical protein NMY22_g7926 [Coprinellus aureogranulatus]
MSAAARRPSIETRSLLESAPPSYHSTDDVSTSPVEDDDPPSPPVNVFSNADLTWMLAGLWAGVLLGAFDGTVVATLLTPIGSEFKASNEASYIGTSYLLSVCCFTPLYGRLADILGRKGAMLLALSLFGSGTILCGAAPSMKALIAARAVAGMGGGGCVHNSLEETRSLALIYAVTPYSSQRHDRLPNPAFSKVSSIAVTDLIPFLYGVGAGLGGPIGGWINDRFGWRMAFYIQAPFFVFAMAVVALKVNIKLSNEIECQSLAQKVQKIDFVGSFTLVGSVGCMLLGFSLKTAEEIPWNSPAIVGLFWACAAFTVTFVLSQKYWASYPVMPLRLISQRTPLAVSMANLFASMSAFSMLYNAPVAIFLGREDEERNYSWYANTPPQPEFPVLTVTQAFTWFPIQAPQIAIPTGSIFAGWLMRRTGKLYGLTLTASFLSIFASLLASTWNQSTPDFHFWADLLFQGFGMASLITTTLIAMITAVFKPDMPVAVGRPDADKLIQSIRHNTLIIPTLDEPIRQAAIDSYADALRVVFICQTLVSILSFICCIPIEERPLAPPVPPSPSSSQPPPIPSRPILRDTQDHTIDSSSNA